MERELGAGNWTRRICWAALRALRQMAKRSRTTTAGCRGSGHRLAARFDKIVERREGATPCAERADIAKSRGIGRVRRWNRLASAEHAQATFDTLQTGYLNKWGLKHTVGNDDRVWTLPTATLSRAAYRYGKSALGFQMLQHVAQTLEYGSIGFYHELIPDGLTNLQLWSGATFVRGVVGLAGSRCARRSACPHGRTHNCRRPGISPNWTTWPLAHMCQPAGHACTPALRALERARRRSR